MVRVPLRNAEAHRAGPYLTWARGRLANHQAHTSDYVCVITDAMWLSRDACSYELKAPVIIISVLSQWQYDFGGDRQLRPAFHICIAATSDMCST